MSNNLKRCLSFKRLHEGIRVVQGASKRRSTSELIYILLPFVLKILLVLVSATDDHTAILRTTRHGCNLSPYLLARKTHSIQ
jgi:hypothetical protein